VTHLAAILFDLGDTLMMEETEVFDSEDTTLRATLLPGAATLLRRLKKQGHRLALVCDARPDSPSNVLRQHRLLSIFEHMSISEVLGVQKPHPLMFSSALDALGVPRAQYGTVVMVGNNLERDMVGANRLGIIPIYIHWTDRRRSQPQSAEETPRHTVHSMAELGELIERIEARDQIQ
jgi:FMN phosphatase YigB (HAD superfamily)